MPWDPKRLELRRWFSRNAPELGAIYAGSVEMVHAGTLPGYSRFVVHAMREIGNALPSILSNKVRRGRLDYKGKVDSLYAKWERLGPSPLDDGSWRELPDAAGHVAVDRRLVAQVHQLLRDHDNSRQTAKEKARLLFEAAGGDGGPHPSLGPVVDQWREITSWAMKHTHVPSDPEARSVDEAELERMFEHFEAMLTGLLGEFYTTVEELDAILEDANS